MLAAEFFVGALLMISLWENYSLYIPAAISSAAAVGLVVWQLVRYIKATDPRVKKASLIAMALFALIPVVVFFIAYVVIAIMIIMAFA